MSTAHDQWDGDTIRWAFPRKTALEKCIEVAKGILFLPQNSSGHFAGPLNAASVSVSASSSAEGPLALTNGSGLPQCRTGSGALGL